MNKIRLGAAAGALLATLCSASAAQGAKDDLTLVSHSLAGPPTRPNQPSEQPKISGDGRYVAFASKATNIAPGATNGALQVLRFDRVTGAVELVSRADGAAGAQGDLDSGDTITEGQIDISADGRFVAFASDADNLRGDDSDSIRNVYVRDMQLGQTLLVSRNDADAAASTDPSRDVSISADGSRVAFWSIEDAGVSNMPGNAAKDDVLVRDLVAGTTTVASVADDEGPASDHSSSPTISADGTRVAFSTKAGNLGADVSDPSEPDARIVMRDLAAGTTQVVSIAPDGAPATSFSNQIAPNGRRVAFLDGNAYAAYVRDLDMGVTFAASRADGPDGAVTASGSINGFDLSFDGRFMSFSTGDDNILGFDADGTDLFDGDGDDVFVRDLALGRTTFVSRAAGPDGAAQENSNVFGGSIDDEGRHLAFDTTAGNLSSADYNGGAVFKSDVFLRDLGDPPPLPIAAPAAPDTVRPLLSRASLRYRRFRVGRGSTAVTAQRRRRRAPRGTTIRLTLSEPATLRIAVQRRLAGVRLRRSGRTRCVSASRRNLAAARRSLARRRSIARLTGAARRRALARALKRARCPIFRGVGVLTRRNRPAGRNSVAFSGRIGRRALRRGSYRFLIGATDAAGNTTARRSALSFTIVR